METLESLDIVVVVFATNDLDVDTIHLYGQRDRTEEEIVEMAIRCIIAEHEQREDAVEGFEVLSIVR